LRPYARPQFGPPVFRKADLLRCEETSSHQSERVSCKMSRCKARGALDSTSK
jgi:hypothetical protein